MAGAVGPISVGAMRWDAVDTSSPMTPGGALVADPYGTKPDDNAFIGGRRRRASRASRKSKKVTRKGRKGKKVTRKSRKMKGGNWNPGMVNAAGAGFGFVGPTSGVTGGIAPAAGYQARIGGAPMNAAGVRSA